MSEQAVVPPDRVLNGTQCSSYAIVVVNEHMLNILQKLGEFYHCTVGGLNEEIAIGDIAVLEGWPLGEVMQLFPDSPDIQRYWSRELQIFSLFDIDADGFTRILRTLIVEDPNATDAVDLSHLHGYQNLSKGLQEFVTAYVKAVLEEDAGYNDMYSAAREAGASESLLDSIELLLERLDMGEPLPEPRRMPRKLTAAAVQRRLHDLGHTTSEDFPHGWELPTATALEAAVEKAQLYGYAFADPAEAATLPAHVAEIIEGAPTPRLS